MALSTDFKDDILNESVNEKRKYQMTYNDDGTVSFTDVTSYSQTGSEYGAAEVNEERQAINELNSALNEHRTYCFDSGWTSYFALSVPTGTNAVVFLDTAIYRVESMTDQMNVNKIATGSADNSTVVRYLEERYVAFRQNDSQGTIRAIVLTSFADVVPRW